MRYLTLVRHAKSSWSHPELTDFERPLNPRGHRDAPVMAARARAALPATASWISSPATRAMMTARLFAEDWDKPVGHVQYEPALYEASLDRLVAVIRGLPASLARVWLFGHNPGLTLLGQWLAPDTAPTHLPTCAIAHYRLTIRDWSEAHPGCGDIEWFNAPKLPFANPAAS